MPFWVFWLLISNWLFFNTYGLLLVYALVLPTRSLATRSHHVSKLHRRNSEEKRQSQSSLSGEQDVVTVTDDVRPDGSVVVETCRIRLTPFVSNDGEDLVRLQKTCSTSTQLAVPPQTDALASTSSSSSSFTTTSSVLASTTPTITRSSTSSSTTSLSSSSATQTTQLSTSSSISSLNLSTSISTATSTDSDSSTSSLPTSTASSSSRSRTSLSPTSDSTSAASTNQVLTSASSSVTSLAPTETTAVLTLSSVITTPPLIITSLSETFVSSTTTGTPTSDSISMMQATTSPLPSLPGTNLEVKPIGLGIFAGLAFIVLAIVAVVTYERSRHRRNFRQRRDAQTQRFAQVIAERDRGLTSAR